MNKKEVYFSTLFVLYFFCSCGCSNDNDISSNNQAIYESGEELLIGEHTINSASNNAFGRAISSLSNTEQLEFGVGNSLFNQAWVAAPASTTARDGLGPTFNSRACANCHAKDGRGLPEFNTMGSKGFLMRISLAGNTAHGAPLAVPNYGDQIQEFANSTIAFEAKIDIQYETIKGSYPDGTAYELRKPIYEITEEQFGSLSGVLTSPRIGTQTIGLGFIDALPDEAILSLADEQDLDQDGISGKPNYVWNVSTNKLELGKFGWKANQPNLKQQIAGAFHGDMGLTTSLFPDENCPTAQQNCNNATNGGNPEVTDQQLDRVTFYQMTLGVPIRRNFKDENVLKGKVLFRQLQCIACHATNFTAGSYSVSGIEGTVFHPYSDFLLHDMGEGLADNRPDFLATGREWRTQPLWGIGLIKTVNNHTFLLHDGRARNVEEAILWHGGEAAQSLSDFKNLAKTERQQLIDFINSL